MRSRKTTFEIGIPGRLAILAVVAACLMPAGVTLAVSQAAEPPPRVAVSPSRFEIEIDEQPSVQSLRLFNFGDEDVAVRVSLASWALDEANQVQLLEPDEQSLDQWIVLNPSRFTVPARSSQTVRFSIRPRVRPEPGEHRAMIYLEQVLPPSSGQQLRVNFKIGVAVYAYAGEIQRRGRLHGVEMLADDDRLAAAFDVASAGNAHVRLQGSYAIWPADRFPGVGAQPELTALGTDAFEAPEGVLMAGNLPSTPVLAGTRRQIPLHVRHQLPPGEYVLGVLGDVAGWTIDEALLFSVGVDAAPTPVVAGQGQD